MKIVLVVMVVVVWTLTSLITVIVNRDIPVTNAK